MLLGKGKVEVSALLFKEFMLCKVLAESYLLGPTKLR